VGGREWCLEAGCEQGARVGEGHPGRLGLGELLPGDGPGGSVRRLQDERLRARVGSPAARRVSERQGGVGQNRPAGGGGWGAAGGTARGGRPVRSAPGGWRASRGGAGGA